MNADRSAPPNNLDAPLPDKPESGYAACPAAVEPWALVGQDIPPDAADDDARPPPCSLDEDTLISGGGGGGGGGGRPPAAPA